MPLENMESVSSRAIVVVGMHRSGTSVVARGLRALSIYLGNNFFDVQPDNPTGYWEDKTIVGINQRVLEELGLTWDDTSLIAYERFHHHRIRLLRLKAVRYLKEAFTSQPLWGFKDPRTIRLLPFWRAALRECGAEDSYVVAVRNPLSVAASLFRRQQIMLPKAQRLWLVHLVPFLHELHDKRLVVVDYDLLTLEPREQLERIVRTLSLPSPNGTSHEIDRFVDGFLDMRLRHNVFTTRDFNAMTEIGRLTQNAYLLLRGLATDRHETLASSFWPVWDMVARRLEDLS